MAHGQVVSLTVAHFAAVAMITAADAELAGFFGHPHVRQVEELQRDVVARRGEPSQRELRLAACEPCGQVVDLVVGLRDDDAAFPGAGQAGCRPDDERALAGAGRGVDDDAARAGSAHVGQDGRRYLLCLIGGRERGWRGHDLGSSASRASGRGPPWVQGVCSAGGYCGGVQ